MARPVPVAAKGRQPDSLRAVAGADRFVGRRREIRREQGARRLRIVVALTAVSLLAVSAIGTLNSELADVDLLTVVGNSRTSTEDVVATTGIVIGHPMLDVDVGAAEQAVARMPWIAAVEISRRFDGEVVVAVSEREPVLALPAANGFMLVDETGYQLERISEQPEAFVPVDGVRANGEPGEYAPEETALVLSFLQGFTPTLRPEVDRLSVDADGLVVALVGGGRAVMGDSSQLGEKIQALETVLARVDLRCVSIIDLRVPSATAVRRSESAEGACN